MSRPQRSVSVSSQRGVALITAVVLVALATLIAVAIGSRSALSARRSAASFSIEQGLQYAAGAEGLASFVLSQDRNAQDTLAEAWAQPYGPVEASPGVMLSAVIRDEQGKFNLNSLLNGQGAIDPQALAVFQRLLELVQIEPRWAALLADWLDRDTLAQGDGGEDSLYMGQTVPHLAGNTPVTSVSELLQLPGFGRERYARLAPFVTALPPAVAKINVCLAPGVVLDALFALEEAKRGTVEYSQLDAKQLADTRSRGCFPTVEVLRATIGPKITRFAGERSQYFRLQSSIQVGTNQFALYSLLQRDDGFKVRPILRTLGTE